MEYYKDKIEWPYVETTGVGKDSRVKTIKTTEEMKLFLRSEESLKVYANYHDVLAIANLFNIKIDIFTYGDKDERWRQVCPDPEMAPSAAYGKWIPDIALYHSYNTHYDLLVKDDCRVALNGFIAGQVITEEDNKDDTRKSDDWELFKQKKHSEKDMQKDEEVLLTEDKSVINEEDLLEELILLSNKNSGNTRTSPQEDSEKASKTVGAFPCDQCDVKLESQGLLLAHIENHKTQNSKFVC